MPKRLMDCVKQLMSKGYSKSSAFAICIKATGQLPHNANRKKSQRKRSR